MDGMYTPNGGLGLEFMEYTRDPFDSYGYSFDLAPVRKIVEVGHQNR